MLNALHILSNLIPISTLQSRYNLLPHHVHSFQTRKQRPREEGDLPTSDGSTGRASPTLAEAHTVGWSLCSTVGCAPALPRPRSVTAQEDPEGRTVSTKRAQATKAGTSAMPGSLTSLDPHRVRRAAGRVYGWRPYCETRDKTQASLPPASRHRAPTTRVS